MYNFQIDLLLIVHKSTDALCFRVYQSLSTDNQNLYLKFTRINN